MCVVFWNFKQVFHFVILTPPKFLTFLNFLLKMQTREKIFSKERVMLDHVLSLAFKFDILIIILLSYTLLSGEMKHLSRRILF